VTVSREEYRRNINRKLTEVQEKKLIKYINTLTDRGNAPTYPLVRRFAQEICKKSVGKNWPKKFVKRYPNDLREGFLEAIEISRKKADSAKSYQLWFDQVFQPISSYIGSSNIDLIAIPIHRSIQSQTIKHV
jgi:hypothetical protein